jgi:mono/diheme cytochrome c family protein
MQKITFNLVIALALIISMGMSGCGKKNDNKPVAKMADSSKLVKDSAGALKDSSVTRNDSSAAGKDSATIAKDSTSGSDSTKATPPPELTYEEMQGKYVYLKYCSVCHGAEGKGDGFNAYNLDPKPRDFSDSGFIASLADERLIEVIRDGGRGVNKSPTMPAYGWTLRKDDIRYVISYVRTFPLPDTVKKIAKK